MAGEPYGHQTAANSRLYGAAMKGPDTQSSHLLRMEGYRDRLMAAGFQLDLAARGIAGSAVAFGGKTGVRFVFFVTMSLWGFDENSSRYKEKTL
ncbi:MULTISPECIES: hypothetical protein [Serratia]|uniref:hypothetical protein n=1 Tax=Serratia TaxID=613 RepID=UPI0033210BD5